MEQIFERFFPPGVTVTLSLVTKPHSEEKGKVRAVTELGVFVDQGPHSNVFFPWTALVKVTRGPAP